MGKIKFPLIPFDRGPVDAANPSVMVAHNPATGLAQQLNVSAERRIEALVGRIFPSADIAENRAPR